MLANGFVSAPGGGKDGDVLETLRYSRRMRRRPFWPERYRAASGAILRRVCIFARFADDELEGEMAGWAGRGDGRAIRAGVVRLRRGGAFRAGAQERGLMVLMACDGSWTQAGRLPGAGRATARMW